MEKTNKVLTNAMRLGFAGWISFELLNYAGVLDFTLDFTWLGLFVTAFFVWLAVEFVSYRVKKSTGNPLPWFVFAGALFSVSFDALGDTMHWYNKFDWYDQAGHLCGTAMAALLSFNALWLLKKSGKIALSPWLVGLFAFTIASTLGVFYELEEYIEDLITGGNRFGDGPDTGNDMLLNTIGAFSTVIIAVIVAYVCRSGRTRRAKNLDAV
ncbi:MAG: hypothetical protein WC505_06525 [Patescibacteria group bacterium]